MTALRVRGHPPVCRTSRRAGCLKVQRRMYIQQHRSEVLPTGSSRRSLVLPVVADASPLLAASWHPDEAAPVGGWGGAKQPHRRLAPSYARRGSPAQCPARDQRFPRGTIVLMATVLMNQQVCRLGNSTASKTGEQRRPPFRLARWRRNAFAQPVELLSCAGSCTCVGICTCAAHLTSIVPSVAPHLASLVPPCASLLTPLHAHGLSLSIGYRQYRRSRREAERSRQSHQRESLSARDHFRLDDCIHVKPP